MGDNQTVYFGDEEYSYVEEYQEERDLDNFSNTVRYIIREHLAHRLKQEELGYELEIEEPQSWQYSDDKLLGDILRVAEEVEDTPSKNEYHKHGEYMVETIERRFGGWTPALEAANLELTRHPTEGSNENGDAPPSPKEQVQAVSEEAKKLDQGGSDGN